MNRIDMIKRLIEENKASIDSYVNKELTEECEYLLSKLEIAEKALVECQAYAAIAMENDYVIVDAWKVRVSDIKLVTVKALQQIRS